MADIIEQQTLPKIMVGDPHQQIYSFRGAVNAMSNVQASHVFYLTQVLYLFLFSSRPDLLVFWILLGSCFSLIPISEATVTNSSPGVIVDHRFVLLFTVVSLRTGDRTGCVVLSGTPQGRDQEDTGRKRQPR